MSYRFSILVMAAAILGAGSASAQSAGETLFKQNCSACHQVTGKGIPGAFPALAGDAFVVGPPEAVEKTVLNGRGGMPTFSKELSNEQIATILTYVRSAWGNHAKAITPAMVAKARGGGDLIDKSKAGMQAH